MPPPPLKIQGGPAFLYMYLDIYLYHLELTQNAILDDNMLFKFCICMYVFLYLSMSSMYMCCVNFERRFVCKQIYKEN